MAIVKMTKTSVLGEDFIYEYKGPTLIATGVGPSVLIPADRTISNISVTLEISGGKGSIETTTSTIEDVEADVAIWEPTDEGDANNTFTTALFPATAVRQVNTNSAGTTLTIRVQ